MSRPSVVVFGAGAENAMPASSASTEWSRESWVAGYLRSPELGVDIEIAPPKSRRPERVLRMSGLAFAPLIPKSPS